MPKVQPFSPGPGAKSCGSCCVLDGGRRGPERDFHRAARQGGTPGIMELQRTSSISGPLSPAYTGQVPYNYNQLEGRFKQLQGKPPPPEGQACPGAVPTGVPRFYLCHMVRDPNEDGPPHGPAPKPLVGCEHPIHSLKETVSHSTLEKPPFGVPFSLSLSLILLALGCQVSATH